MIPGFQEVVPEADQTRYTIGSMADGTFSAKADCNQLSGSYTTTGTGGLTILPGPMALAACPDDSLGDQYVAAQATSESYAIADGQLTITHATGTLAFK